MSPPEIDRLTDILTAFLDIKGFFCNFWIGKMYESVLYWDVVLCFFY